MTIYIAFICSYFDVLLQDYSNSIANALELLQFCIKPKTVFPEIGIRTMKIYFCWSL